MEVVEITLDEADQLLLKVGQAAFIEGWILGHTQKARRPLSYEKIRAAWESSEVHQALIDKITDHVMRNKQENLEV
ncbi:MAG: hypothetical protein D6711_13800 [Chloroflexi bacterium]|nr:MAG: hypothetical protein D6711_13800 [Chloroflexota bacterium]